MKSDQDLFDTIQAGKQFNEGQNEKIYDWMVEDDEYRAYMLTTIPPPEDKFLQNLSKENPKNYLRTFFAFGKLMEKEGCG